MLGKYEKTNTGDAADNRHERCVHSRAVRAVRFLTDPLHVLQTLLRPAATATTQSGTKGDRSSQRVGKQSNVLRHRRVAEVVVGLKSQAVASAAVLRGFRPVRQALKFNASQRDHRLLTSQPSRRLAGDRAGHPTPQESPKIRQDIAMHQCLLVHELLQMVAGSVGDQGSLTNMALACRAFYDPALNVLWSRLDGLLPLLKCLPSKYYRWSEQAPFVCPYPLSDCLRTLCL